jgi:hypothetical protein
LFTAFSTPGANVGCYLHRVLPLVPIVDFIYILLRPRGPLFTACSASEAIYYYHYYHYLLRCPPLGQILGVVYSVLRFSGQEEEEEEEKEEEEEEESLCFGRRLMELGISSCKGSDTKRLCREQPCPQRQYRHSRSQHKRSQHGQSQHSQINTAEVNANTAEVNTAEDITTPNNNATTTTSTTTTITTTWGTSGKLPTKGRRMRPRGRRGTWGIFEGLSTWVVERDCVAGVALSALRIGLRT